MKNLKLLLAVVFIIIFSYRPVLAAARVEVSPDEFSLGELPEGKIFKYELTVANAGDEDLKIKPINVSCSCVEIIEPKSSFTLTPAEMRKVVFSFDTTGFVGVQKKYIFLDTNDPAKKTLRIKVEAEIKEHRETFIERFKGFGLGTIIFAGLMDGLNPCAFTVLVFFVSFLTFVGYKRREMLIIGGIFILSVFFTYLLIGMGLFRVLMQTQGFNVLSRVVYISTGVLAIALGLMSFYDAYIFKKTGNPEMIKLKLPGVIKKQIHGVIRQTTDIRKDTASGLRTIKFAFSALICGFLVTLLESVCTGQLYVPTIAYIFGIPQLKAKAFLYLVLYNLMFVIPLAGILVFGVSGVTSSDFARFAQRHIVGIKSVTALVFLLLGGVLLILR